MESQLRAVRKMGVSISLDDFGTGQSSLSYLSELPLDTVKIDRSFVLNIENDERKRNLLKSVTSLCQTLGQAVVIEGVETEVQLEVITEVAGPDRIQGWVYAPALPASAIGAFGSKPGPIRAFSLTGT
jgi:EAL domain-containing protein (putative c-di-GMP-specific phosphodiesterase class I)